MAEPLVRYHVAVSIDGFVAPVNGSADWLSESSGSDDFERFISTIGGIVMGRDGFETELGFGPWAYGHLPVLVMTNRPIAHRPPGVATACGNPTLPLATLKARVKRGDIWLYGGGVVAGCFLDAGLIDRVEVTTIPVALGTGRSLFSGARRSRCLELIESRSTGSAITSRYRPAKE